MSSRGIIVAITVVVALAIAVFVAFGPKTPPPSDGQGGAEVPPPSKAVPPAPAAPQNGGEPGAQVPVPEADGGTAPAAVPSPRPSERAEVPPDQTGDALAGLEMRDATATEVHEMGVPERAKGGVVVTSVHPRSSAAEAHLEPGDVIIKAHTSYVTTADELRSTMGDREHTLIEVYRNGKPFQVVLHKPWQGEK